jgi:hypothetical protein
MARTFVDRGLLTWEVFPSAGDYGFSTNPHLVFNCLSDRMARPRYVELDGHEAGAETMITDASDAMLLDLLSASKVVD